MVSILRVGIINERRFRFTLRNKGYCLSGGGGLDLHLLRLNPYGHNKKNIYTYTYLLPSPGKQPPATDQLCKK